MIEIHDERGQSGGLEGGGSDGRSRRPWSLPQIDQIDTAGQDRAQRRRNPVRSAPWPACESAAVRAGSAPSSPSRWPATRSGTRSERDRKGRSVSSTSTRPAAISGASGENRLLAPADQEDAPHSSRLRPTVARRRVTSSLR